MSARKAQLTTRSWGTGGLSGRQELPLLRCVLAGAGGFYNALVSLRRRLLLWPRWPASYPRGRSSVRSAPIRRPRCGSLRSLRSTVAQPRGQLRLSSTGRRRTRVPHSLTTHLRPVRAHNPRPRWPTRLRAAVAQAPPTTPTSQVRAGWWSSTPRRRTSKTLAPITLVFSLVKVPGNRNQPPAVTPGGRMAAETTPTQDPSSVGITVRAWTAVQNAQARPPVKPVRERS